MGRTRYAGDGYGAPVAARLAGLRPSTLHYWIRTGLVKPSVGKPRGRGFTRAFSWKELIALRTAAELRKANVPLQSIRKAIGLVRRYKGINDPLGELRLVAAVAPNGKPDVQLLSGESAVSLVQQPGQAVITTFDVAAMVRDLRERADALEQERQAAVG